MHVHIVCYEKPPNWILGKISYKLCDAINALGIESSISNQPNFDADVNHHIYYLPFEGHKTNLDTLLVTHIDTKEKLKILLGQLSVADGAVFFSAQTKNVLQMAGAPKNKLITINPPHDGVIKPRKLWIGLLSNIYPNYRKRENFIFELVSSVNLTGFEFIIMGTGWERFIQLLKQKNIKYTWYSEFKYDEYVKIVPQLDYFLYTGIDEGSMAFLDILAADVKTIVTPQGFHLDSGVPIDHPFETVDELKEIFKQIIIKRRLRPNSIGMWTWENYAKHHIAFWRSLINQKV